MKDKDIKKLMKREYLRGYINGGMPVCTMGNLDKIYKKYLKDNPDVFNRLETNKE